MNFLHYLNWRYRRIPYRVLGMDMGSKNSAISIVEYVYNKDPKLLFAEIVPQSIDSMGKTLTQQTRQFRRYFTRIILSYKPDVVVPELFMQRSFRSNLASPISYTIGVITEICHLQNIPVKATMPSHWKKDLEKQITRVDNIYDRTYPIKERLPDHPVDATCLSIFYSPQKFKGITLCQLKQLVVELKSSTLIQAWLEQEKKKKPLPKKSKRLKKVVKNKKKK